VSCENLQRPAAYDVVIFQARKLASKTNAEKLARELAKEHARRKKQQQLRSILLQMNLYYRRVGMNAEASHQSLVCASCVPGRRRSRMSDSHLCRPDGDGYGERQPEQRQIRTRRIAVVVGRDEETDAVEEV
jgi:hypothetical protein